MAKDLFFSMDLNLLRTFLVLSQELNTRKAAERLFVSQPAISQALQKLRNQLDDPLFVKAPSGLKATQFAEELARDITPYLNGLSTVLNKGREFDPLSFQSSVKIAVAPVVLSCLSGSLYRHFSKVAPHCTLELVAWKSSSMNHIQNDELTIGVSLKQAPVQSVHVDLLAELEGKIIVRSGHPLTNETVTAQELEPYPIASVITPGYNDNFTEAAVLMEKEGLIPTIGFRTEFVMAVVDVIEHTDFFMPHSDLFPIQRYPSLKAITPLVNGVPYRNSIYAYYHTKHKNTALMLWLVEQIQQVIKQETKH
ncbi:LysR family transcriptional regulator [Vibrio algarum]|uniref:LysR family transcriptional regulator n=1 Tax=Vibrio algarum TaxID=3020714 RepID=A0ABT4YXR4_9VIBR|nr:LysR family transcriptional regulator [Vibrio sp. KJ40-1]MDB1125961.1 LysR family transcriptional regulator [Vibrio sp. KJ40-1]